VGGGGGGGAGGWAPHRGVFLTGATHPSFVPGVGRGGGGLDDHRSPLHSNFLSGHDKNVDRPAPPPPTGTMPPYGAPHRGGVWSKTMVRWAEGTDEGTMTTMRTPIPEVTEGDARDAEIDKQGDEHARCWRADTEAGVVRVAAQRGFGNQKQ